MIRRLLLFLGLPLGLLALALGLAYGFRQEVARYFLDDQLQSHGLAALRYEIESVELDGASLTAIAWEDGERMALTRLQVDFDPWKVLSGEIEGITIEGLRLQLDLTGTAPIFDGLPEGLAGSPASGPADDGADAMPATLPPITLVDAIVEAKTPAGPARVQLEGDVLPDGVGGLAGAFDLALSGDLGKLAGSLSITRNPGGLTIGAAVLEDGSLELPGGSVGGLGGEFDFRFGGAEPPRVRGEFTLSAIDMPRQLFDTADLLIVLDQGQFLADGYLHSPDRKAEARVRLAADKLFAEPAVSLESSVKLQAGSALWPLLGFAQPARGGAQFQLRGEGTLPNIERLTLREGGLIGWLAAGDTRGRLEVSLDDLAFLDSLQGLVGTIVVDWGLTQGVIVAGLPQDLAVEAANIDPDWLEAIGFPADTAAALAGGVAVTMPAQAAADPRFYLQPSAGGHLVDIAGTLQLEATDGARAAIAGVLTLDMTPRLELVSLSLQGLALQAQELPLDGHVLGSLKIGGNLEGTPDRLSGDLGIQVGLLQTELGGYPASDMTIAGPFGAVLAESRLTLTLQDEGEISLGQLLLDDLPILPDPASGTLQSGEVSLDWSSGDLILTHDTVAKLGDERLVFGEGSKAVTVAGDFGRVRLVGRTNADFDYAGTLGITEADVALPSYGLTLGGTTISWIFPFPDEAPAPGHIIVADGAVTTALGRIRGLTLEADAVESETGITLSGSGKGPGGVGRVALVLTDDSATGKGSLTADWGPVTFKAGGLQPGQLLGYFKDFEQVAGKLRLGLTFSWTETSGSSAAKVTLTDFSFLHPQAAVEGLDTTITFDRLANISTRPGQKLKIRKIDIGMPMTDVTASLQIKPGRGTAYLLSDIAFTLSGGRFSLPALAFDPAVDSNEAVVSIANLDLAKLTAELGISEFAMEGKMSGRLPIAFRPSDETITVTGGKLANTTPGVIHYGKPGTSSLRAGGDENFALALEALENFQFKTLDLTIDKEADGSTRLYIILEGNNPDVLDGYPFRININLQTNLAQVLDALREGYRLNPDLFKGGWTFN